MTEPAPAPPSGTPPHPLSPFLVLALGVTAALGTGLAESLILFLRRHALHTFTWTSQDAYWLTPLVYVMLLGPGIVALAAGARLLPRVVTLRTVVFVLAWVGVLSLLFLLLHRKLHIAAQILLAAGVAARIAGAATRHTAAWQRAAPRLALVFGVLVALLATAPLVRIARERWTLAHLPDPAAGAPNVILIILDTVRAASLSVYGAAWPTSAGLERWGARGVVFDRAYTTTSWTLPSHAGMFTGRYPHELSTDWLRRLDGREPTVAELFAAAGFRTGGFVGNLFYTSSESGLARGFHHYSDYVQTRYQVLVTSALGQLLEETRTDWQPARRTNMRRRAPSVTRAALSWIRSDPHPFFVFLNYFDAHQPYEPLPQWRGRFRGDNRLLALYEESIAGLDAHLDTLFATLEQERLLANTVVIVTSDHGESVGEHGLTEHGSALYVEDLHVPLLLFGAGIPAGRRIPAAVSLVDLGATVIDLAGIGSALPGYSLAPLWRDSAAATTHSPALAELEPHDGVDASTPVARGPMRSIVRDQWHLIQRGDGALELYDLARDPEERHDLSRDPAHGARLAELRDALRNPGSGDRDR